MWRERSRALRGPLLFVWVLAAAVLLGAHPVSSALQAAVTGSGAPGALPPVEALQLRRTTVFSSPAPTGFRGGTQCDSEGHAFVQFAVLGGFPLHVEPFSSISEIILDDRRIVAYRTPRLSESDYPHATVTSFGVTPDGRLYALVFTRRFASGGRFLSGPAYYVERFKDDGASDSITPIQTPPGVAHWYADLLVPFSGGELLITGTSTTEAKRPGPSSWRPFTAIYGPSGRFVRQVALPQDISSDSSKGDAAKPRAGERPKAQSSQAQAPNPKQYFDVAISTGGLVSGPDGNVWILRESDPIRLYAVDSAGEVFQHFEVSPPAPGLMPFDFGFVSPEEVFFEFVRLPRLSGHSAPSPSPKGPSNLIGVFNTISQRFEALYALPEGKDKMLGTIACSDGNGGFLYLGSTRDGRLAVYDYAPR